jgi:hypothetical protein
MKEKNIDIWKRKREWVAENGGMALVYTHLDYMDFDGDMAEIRCQRSGKDRGRRSDIRGQRQER